jgi:hypothetical protein
MFQTPYFSEILAGPGIEPRNSGSVARNSDHHTTEAVQDVGITCVIYFLSNDYI